MGEKTKGRGIIMFENYFQINTFATLIFEPFY
jgi:hypothetical protein